KTDPTFNSADQATAVWQQVDLANKVDRQMNCHLDGTAMGWNFFSGDFAKAPARYDVPSGFVQSADDAYDQVLNYSGAFWWQRDGIDARIVNDTRTFRGGNIRYAEDVGGWINVAEVRRPKDFDTDGDGMPDAWEIAHGLDPKVDDHNGDYNHDGYTNIEKYFHDLAAFPAPKPLTYMAKFGRFEDVGNWDQQWKPSRYDEAKLPAGTAVTVDSLGQAARSIDVADGASLTVSGGSLSATHLEISPKAKVAFTGGRLDVNNIDGSFAVAGGTLSAGVGVAGQLQVDGDLTIQSGTLLIEATGRDVNDRMDVRGDLILGGDIQVDLLNGYQPKPGTKLLLGMAKHVKGEAKLPDGWTLETKEETATANPFYFIYLVAK
ncbi:MAG: cellulose-binding family, partial [Phycisphaerales bacterium]|nr:cellulose-binding family [Phycisphaerales bacterium]